MRTQNCCGPQRYCCSMLVLQLSAVICKIYTCNHDVCPIHCMLPNITVACGGTDLISPALIMETTLLRLVRKPALAMASSLRDASKVVRILATLTSFTASLLSSNCVVVTGTVRTYNQRCSLIQWMILLSIESAVMEAT